jgi:hypothetical protein
VVGWFGVAPSASADKIVFTRVSGRSADFVVMRPDGRQVSVAPAFDAPYDVSPDGRRLVGGSGPGLVVTPFTARDRLARRRARVLSRRSPGTWPQWSPDGRSVAGVREVGGLGQVFVLRLGGGPPRRLRAEAGMYYPSWSPDGRRIVAQGERYRAGRTPPTPERIGLDQQPDRCRLEARATVRADPVLPLL